MRIAAISDAHLAGLDDPAQADLVALLDGLDAGALYLLGDIFDCWWPWPGVVQEDFLPALAALHRLVRRGVELTCVPGNHDFRPGPFFARRLGARVLPRVELELAGRRYLLVHGDEADSSPGYRAARAVLRSTCFAALMRVLGPVRGRALGLRLAGASRDSAPGRDALVEAQRRWARARLREGFDSVVMGHSHVAGITALPEGELVNPGDFGRERTWLWLDEGGPRLRRWRGPSGG